ncbi:MAG: SUMF1/EgtB/PvdO family nonheme iron enzyme [Proteobacteria bacterium]|nr:SUMF1/EgtB/PvdO family nonheme iron enzyme [Pseudomonadota bacterium]MCP4919975.1 SUMF1/EgtB/PvdO family nonheme iron enzyme [Pseudomonadota bacterium]
MRLSHAGPATPGPVGLHPVDTSPYGVGDLAGLIREWTSSMYDEDQLVVRGGSWQDDEDDLRAASRAGRAPASRSRSVGLRLISSSAVPSGPSSRRSSPSTRGPRRPTRGTPRPRRTPSAGPPRRPGSSSGPPRWRGTSPPARRADHTARWRPRPSGLASRAATRTR